MMREIRRRTGSIFLLTCFLLVQLWTIQNINIQAEDEKQKVKKPEQLYARSAVLMDGENGRILFGKEETKERPMASTTKIMTCILALEKGKPNDIVRVSEKAAAQPKVHLGMKKDEQFYLEDLVYSMMLESHNDSAWAVAEHIGNGSGEMFIDMMNQKAKEIGCEHTHFVTPNGLDGTDAGGKHRTTASDLAQIMRYCILKSPHKEEFLKITQTKSKKITDTAGKRSFLCSNHNAFLNMMDGVLSGKTGFTGEAGYCYIGAVKQGERVFIVALLACGWPNNKGYKWKDMRTLIQYGSDNYTYRNFWKDAEKKEEVRILEAGKRKQVANAAQEEAGLYKEGIAKIFANITEEQKKKKILMKQDEEIEIRIEEQAILKAPLKKGKKIGEISVYLNKQKLDECELVIGENIEKKTLVWIYRKIWENFFL